MLDRFSAAEGGDGAEQRPHAHHVESATEQGWVMLSLSLYTRIGLEAANYAGREESRRRTTCE